MPIAPISQALPDILGPGLKLVFVGLNPGMAAATGGHHFLGRGNRFWKVLHLAGCTAHQVAPEQDASLLALGYGLTTVVARPTARADQLDTGEFAQAAEALLAKMERDRPRGVAFLGKAAYSEIVGRKNIGCGKQDAPFGGAEVWVLPNPSGLNRAFSLAQLVAAYRAANDALMSQAGPGMALQQGRAHDDHGASVFAAADPARKRRRVFPVV